MKINLQCDKCGYRFTCTEKDVIDYRHIDYKAMEEYNKLLTYCLKCNHSVICDEPSQEEVECDMQVL